MEELKSCPMAQVGDVVRFRIGMFQYVYGIVVDRVLSDSFLIRFDRISRIIPASGIKEVMIVDMDREHYPVIGTVVEYTAEVGDTPVRGTVMGALYSDLFAIISPEAFNVVASRNVSWGVLDEEEIKGDAVPCGCTCVEVAIKHIEKAMEVLHSMSSTIDEEKSVCRIGSVFTRPAYPHNFYALFKWNGEVRFLNVTRNRMWSPKRNLRVSQLQDPMGETLTAKEFQRITGLDMSYFTLITED